MEAVESAVVAAQGAGDGVGVVGLFEGFLDGGGEDGVGAGFDVGVVSAGGEGVGGFVEADGLAQVGVPVGGVEGGGVDPGVGDGGEQRDGGCLWGDGCEVVQDLLADVFDLGGVGGVVDGDQPGADVVGFGRCDEFGDGLGLAGDDGVGGAVDGGDRDAVAPWGQALFDVGGGEVDGGHGAVAAEGVDGLAAEGDDAGGVVEGEGSGDVGGGDFALAVSDDGVGVDAVVLPEFGEGDHDGPQGGLDDVDAVQGGRVGGLP